MRLPYHRWRIRVAEECSTISLAQLPEALHQVSTSAFKPNMTLDAGTYMVSCNLQNESGRRTARAAVMQIRITDSGRKSH